MITKADIVSRMKEIVSTTHGVRIVDSSEIFVGNGVSKWGKNHVDATEKFKYSMSDISKIRNLWKIEPKYIRYTDNTVILDSVKIVTKPVKGFDMLNKYLVNHCHVPALKYDDIYFQWVVGKRDNYDVDSEELLCHDDNKCREYLKALRDMKAYIYKVKIEFKLNRDYGDRFASNGEDRECEWQGSFDRSAYITLHTKTYNKTTGTLFITA